MNIGNHALFVPGPVNSPDALRNAVNVPLENHRNPDFPAFLAKIMTGLADVFKMKNGRCFLFPGSGTGGWEAALTNCLSPGDKVLTSVVGQFSLLWYDMCKRHGLDATVMEVPWGEGAPVEEYARVLEEDKRHEIRAVLVCHNETTTGVTSDVAAIRKVMDALGHPALLIVDAVSSLASIAFYMDEWGVDVAVSGSQKGFMLPTGLSILAASNKALEAAKYAKCPCSYFNFADMIKANDVGSFPYTPATTLLHGLSASIDLLLAEGLENVWARHFRISQGVREAVKAWGLKLCARKEQWESDTVSAIMTPPHVNGDDIVNLAYHRYNMSLGVGLNKVAGKLFRIGHMGWVNEVVIMQALCGAEMAMYDLGLDIALGSGVSAAQKYYCQTAQPVAQPDLAQKLQQCTQAA